MSSDNTLKIIQAQDFQDAENYVVTTDANGNAVSYVFDDEWDFSQSRNFSDVTEQRSISFKNISLNLKKEIQSTLAIFVKKYPKQSVNTLIYKRGHLIRLAKSLGSTNWSELDNDLVFRHFKSNVKKHRYSTATIQGTLVTLNQLSLLKLTSRYIADIKTNSKKLACNNKVEKLQHIAIPEAMATNIFSCAEKIIEKYHPFRKEISAAYSYYYQAREKFINENPNVNSKEFWALAGKNLKHNISIEGFEVRSNSNDLDLIKTACMIIIVGYSGVRHGEGLSIPRDGYDEKTYHEFVIPFIRGFITKPNESGKATEEAWITHPIVKNALELLFDCTEFAREIYRKKYSDNTTKLKVIEAGLLSTNIPYHEKNVLWSTTSLNTWLNKFLRLFDIRATAKDVIEFNKVNSSRKGQLKEDGYLPKLSSHDFRRTFAVFLTRNKLGNIMTLKKQYKHLNVLMSQWYANGSNLAADLDIKVDGGLQELIGEANILIMTETAFEVFNSPTLSGEEGERIDKERSKESYSGSIYLSKKELERQIRAGDLSIVEHPTGYCFNPSCSRICSSNLSTVTCKHEAVTKEKAQDLASTRIRLISKYNNLLVCGGEYRSIRNLIFTEIKAIEFTLSKHEIPFDPFIDPSSPKAKGK